jgi:hypothetical protein
LSNSFLQMLRVAIALGAVAGAGETARAQQKIGSAAAVINDVTRELAGATSPLKAGDPVFRDELVRTAEASKAKLIFLDSTNLVVGPSSQVTLDEFVYSGPTAAASAQKMEVSLTKGVFRFTTGTLDKKAYLISTSNSSIALRGTVLDIDVRRGLSRVTLREGRALVCPRPSGACVELNAPGQTAQVTTIGGVNHASLSSSPVDVASVCAGAAGSLCAAQGYASAAGFPRGALCGH